MPQFQAVLEEFKATEVAPASSAFWISSKMKWVRSL